MSNLCRVCSCTEFVAHAFLKQKCINCNHTLVQHQPEGAETDKSNPSTPSSNNAGSVSLASPSSTSVGRLPFSSPSKQQQQPSLPSPSSANSAPTATGNATNPVNTAAAEIAAASAPAPNVPLPPPPRKGSLPPPLPPFLRSGSPTSSSSPATGPAVPPPPPPAQALPPPVTPTNTNAGNGTATPSTSSAAQATAAAAAAAAAAATSSSAAPPRPPPRPSLTGTQISAGISGTFPAASALRPPPTPPTTSIPTTVVPPPLNTASSPSPPPLSVTGTVEPSLAVATPSPSPSPFAPFSPAAISPSMNQTPAASASVAAAGAATNSALSLPPTPSNPRASVADKKPPPPPPMPRSVSAPDDNTTPVAPVAATTTAATTTTATAAPTPSKEPRGSATWIDPNYRPSFAQKLHHKFDVVVEQSNNGMRLLKRVRAFMTRFSKLQEHYATELQKITSVERNKLIAMQRPDMMISCYTSWLGFFENMDELSRANLEFSQELKEVTVEQLEKWYGIGGTMVKEQKQEQERVHQAMLKVNIAVVKERDIANQSLQKLATKRGTGIDTDTPSSSSGSGGEKSGETKKGSNFMDSIFKNSNPQKSFEKSREAAIKACENYSQTLTQSNISHAKYHQDELPAMMTQMQSLEEMRLHSLSSALRDFSRMQKTFMESLKKISNSIQEYSAGVDANADIANYVDRVCMEHGPALPPVPFTYDLPLSVAELKSMTFDEPPSSLFYSTLDGVMKHQKGMEATLGTTASTVAASSSTIISATGSTSTGNGGAISTRPIALELPLIVPTLLRGIYENGGMTSEGIFRISVGSEELTRSRRQLESGDYTLKETNPHVFACLLKSWFRDLLAPVFPYDSYAKCIAIGSIEPYTPATHALQIKSLMADLPPLNEKILAVLFGFLKKLSGNTEYVSKTRMNLANLSLVFSPGLVRSEKNDPLQMLQDTKYASNFVYRAIEATPQCFRDDSQKFSNQLLEEIFAANVNPR